MRVVSWNIYNGGQDGPSADVSPLPRDQVARLSAILKVLKASAADIIVLREANHFDASSGERAREFEAALGMRSFVARAATGFHVAAFVNRKAKVLHARTYGKGPFHAGIDLYIGAADGSKLRVIGGHLLPFAHAQLPDVTQFSTVGLRGVAVESSSGSRISSSCRSRMEPRGF